MNADWICGPGGQHVAYVDASFCARCGVALPIRMPNDPHPSAYFEPTAAAGRGIETEAWVSAGGALYLVTSVGQHWSLHRRVSGNSVALGTLPALENLIVAPLATSRGLYFVYRSGVVACVNGALQNWDAPEGSSLTGATAGGCGELWVAAIRRDGGLRLLCAGTNGWRVDDEVVIPGFGGGQEVALTIAARSARPFRGEVVIWGAGMAAVVSGRAVVALKREQHAPHEPVRLYERRDLPLIATTGWRSGGLHLLPAPDRRIRAMQLDGAALSTWKIDAVGAAVLTGSGRLYCRTADGVTLSENPASAQISRPLAGSDGMLAAAGALALFGSAIVQDASGALWSWTASGVRSLELVQGASGSLAPAPALMPPLSFGDGALAARRSPVGLTFLYLPLTSGAAAGDAG